MTDRDITNFLLSKYKEWRTCQEGQKDGYEYEQSFSEMWQKLGNALLQESIGELPGSRNEKKTPNQLRGNHNP